MLYALLPGDSAPFTRDVFRPAVGAGSLCTMVCICVWSGPAPCGNVRVCDLTAGQGNLLPFPQEEGQSCFVTCGSGLLRIWHPQGRDSGCRLATGWCGHIAIHSIPACPRQGKGRLSPCLRGGGESPEASGAIRSLSPCLGAEREIFHSLVRRRTSFPMPGEERHSWLSGYVPHAQGVIPVPRLSRQLVAFLGLRGCSGWRSPGQTNLYHTRERARRAVAAWGDPSMPGCHSGASPLPPVFFHA